MRKILQELEIVSIKIGLNRYSFIYLTYISLLIIFIVISNWVAADPSAGKESKRSYVHSNILATKHGCVTAESMRLYAIAHPNIRLKEEPKADEEGGGTKKKGNHEGPFGITTKL